MFSIPKLVIVLLFIIEPTKYSSEEINLSQVINIVMLGFFASYCGYDQEELIKVMKENISTKFFESNVRAYELGKQIFKEKGHEA